MNTLNILVLTLTAVAYNETATITLHCLTKHVGELLPVVKELITDSTMPQEELDIYQAKYEAAAESKPEEK